MVSSNRTARQEQQTKVLGPVRMKLTLQIVKIQRERLNTFEILEKY